MLSLIIFGIVAVIVVVFLLNFNIKAVARSEKRELQIDKQSELLVNSTIVAKSQYENQQNFKKIHEKSDKPQMSDEQYRRALREFHLSQGENLTPTSVNRLNDAAYRTAVRSIKNQTKKE